MACGDTPAPLRGFQYSTHLTQRCPSFHKCPLCSMCRRFDKHNAQCVECESRKPKGMQTCTCTSGQIVVMKELERRSRKPLFDVGGVSADKICDLADTSEGQRLDQLIKEEFNSRVEHTHVSTNETIRDAVFG